MSSSQSGPDRKSQASSILETLAEKLPDSILREYSGEVPAEQVRIILRKAAQAMAPGRVGHGAPSRVPVPKKDASNRDWEGKLKGETLLLFTDGASRGNPGEAGAGIAILDMQGSELLGRSKYLGQCTNNEAEYRALLFGLETCQKFGRGRLKVHLDSELIVRQIMGKYRVKHPNLIPLYQKTMLKLSQFASYGVCHVRRENNSRADELANAAIDNHMQ